jgi:pantoate--beta-alanine ligase
MRVFEDPKAFQAACLDAREEGDLGFVPTMGYLHDGHEALMRRARAHRTSALSIFVNPSQFGPNEDLSRYPRDLPGDLRRAEACGVDLVLSPSDPASIYPAGFQTWVEPGPLASMLEGEHRPGHFRGVATVVLKLLQLTQATHAYFGTKDFQQLAVVRRLVTDLDLAAKIIGVETVREPDGLARSSRNVYLPQSAHGPCASGGRSKPYGRRSVRASATPFASRSSRARRWSRERTASTTSR